jgi:membrane protein YqaA with SNARE-associated domain
MNDLNMVSRLLQKKSVVILCCSLLLVFLAIVFQQKLSEFTSLGLIGIFLINLFGSATLFLPAPAIASVVAGGVLYNPIFVALFSSLGSACGELVAYFVGISGRKVIIKKKDHKLYTVFFNLFHKFGSAAVFVFALVPNPFFDFFGILAGVFAVPLWRFFLLVFLARFLRDVLLASVGAKLPGY